MSWTTTQCVCVKVISFVNQVFAQKLLGLLRDGLRTHEENVMPLMVIFSTIIRPIWQCLVDARKFSWNCSLFFLLTCSTGVLFWGKFNVASSRSFIRTATLGLEYEGTFGGEGRERYHKLPLLPFLDHRSPFWYSFFSTQPSAAVKKIATIFTRKIMITRSLAKIRRALPTLLFYSSPHPPYLKVSSRWSRKNFIQCSLGMPAKGLLMKSTFSLISYLFLCRENLSSWRLIQFDH